MFFQGINYWTVIIATVAGFVVGYIWYSPWAFGGMWARAKGIVLGPASDVAGGSTGESNKGRSMAFTLPTMIVSTFISAFVLSTLFHSLVVTSIGGVLMVALCVWVGFAVPIKLGDYLFGRESLTSFLISIGQSLAAIAVMALITGIWG